MTELAVEERNPTAPKARKWRPNALSAAIVAFSLGGLGMGLYPMTAGWVSSYNQSRVIVQALTDLEGINPLPLEQLELAHDYNDALISGVQLEPGGNVPVGVGNLSGTELRYDEMLTANSSGLMARVKIPSIAVDLPIYHGTSEATLLRGAGHLEGTHLPVGGEGTRSVITAHRGLANSTMFTNLNQVKAGNTFTIEVLGEVLVYQIFEIQVIEPHDSGSLRSLQGRDLVTLVTCTPLGINSHRILVTGERIAPTPLEAIRDAGDTPSIPGFPWWIIFGSGGIILAAVYLIRRGFVDAQTTPAVQKKPDPSTP